MASSLTVTASLTLLTAAVAAQSPGVGIHVAIIVAMLLLTESFGRDVIWQWRRRVPRSPVAEAAAVSTSAV